MPAINFKITYNGQDLIIPDPALIERFKRVLPKDKEIGFYTYSATASDPGEGFFFVTRDSMLALINDVMYDTEALGKATLKFISSDGDSATEIDIPNVYIGPLTRQLHSTLNETIYLLHLVDQRWQSARMHFAGESITKRYFNLLMPDGATFINDTLNGGVAWKWSELCDRMLVDSHIISTTGTLAVPTDDPESDPFNFSFIMIPAVVAMDHLMACNGWVFVYNPFTTACTVEDIAVPATPLRTALADLGDRLIMGGITHARYNYDTWDEGSVHDKYLGSDLYAIPFNPAVTVPYRINNVWQSRYAEGRYPTSALDSADAEQVFMLAVRTNLAAVFDVIDADFKSAFDSWTRTTSYAAFFDIKPALRVNSSPFGVTNALALADRGKYLAARLMAGFVAPRGVLVYDGFHQIAPSAEIFRVSIGVDKGIPITRLDLEYRPPAMFGASFDGRPTGAGIMPEGNCQVYQRADGSYAVRANTPLTPFFDETDAGELCS